MAALPTLPLCALLGLLSLSACKGPGDADAPTGSDGDSGASGAHAVDAAIPGPYIAAHTRITVGPSDRRRSVSLWYPAAAEAVPASATSPTEIYVEDLDERDSYQDLLGAAPSDCPTTETTVAPDAAAAPGPWPLVLFSHCHACTRFSSFAVAEHLASHGFVVAAPDHTGNTLWDQLGGNVSGLNGDTLDARVADLGATLDDVLAGAGLPEGLTVDAARVGALGHSFGSVSVGHLAAADGRIGPVAGLAAPMANPLFPGLEMAQLDQALLFVLAEEDNSIGAIGNQLLVQNHADAPGPAWLVRIADGGHWSVSDLVGLTEDFMPGCGTDMRQDGGEEFAYIDPPIGRRGTAAVVTAFFLEQVGDASGSMERTALEAGFTVEFKGG